jgi:flagellar basal body-associated protein FliL
MQPTGSAPAKKSNATVIIIIAIVVIICCCCIVVPVVGYNFGDAIYTAVRTATGY